MGVGRGARGLGKLVRCSVILGGLVTIFGCPQATSSQRLQSPTTAGDTSAAVLATATSETVTTEICHVQPDWQRPSEAEQQKYLSADPRFAAAIEVEPLKTAADTFWQNDILSFTTYGLSARMEPMLLSGLWSATDQVWESCYGDEQTTAINAGELAEAWLVGHRLVDVRWHADRYIMTVEPSETGLEVVHFNRVESQEALPLQVVDTLGNTLERISGDYE